MSLFGSYAPAVPGFSRLTIEADTTLLGKKEKRKTPVLDAVRLAAEGDSALIALAQSVEAEIQATLAGPDFSLSPAPA